MSSISPTTLNIPSAMCSLDPYNHFVSHAVHAASKKQIRKDQQNPRHGTCLSHAIKDIHIRTHRRENHQSQRPSPYSYTEHKSNESKAFSISIAARPKTVLVDRFLKDARKNSKAVIDAKRAQDSGGVSFFGCQTSTTTTHSIDRS